MRAHRAGHVDTHHRNVALHPCTQGETDKVAIGLGCRLINSPPSHIPLWVVLFILLLGFYLGAAVAESAHPGPGTARTSPTVH